MNQTFEIKTIFDILRILKEHPEILLQIRSLILTEDLIELPKKFETFVNTQFLPLKQDVETLKLDVETLKHNYISLKQTVDILKQDVEILKQDVAKLKNDVNALKGSDFERRVREKAPAFFGKLIRNCKLLHIENLATFLEQKVDEGIISEDEKDDLLNIDVVVSGYLKSNKNIKVLIAAEVSLTLNENDLIRVKRRSDILSKAYQLQTIPVLIGEADQSLHSKASELNVILI
ncbi:MAG: hypothetical protein NZ853_08055 [Leptospiraceae bacterium]|nr:hypothetical protein [Leptospiraceae bacterium]MDW7976874.1 hypothetical protein [Leptospiraceae bacterium]